MKKLLLTCILAIVMAGNLWAAKSIYIPSGWSYNSSTGEYTQDGYSYSMSRKRESDNFVVFWSSEYGSTAPDALPTSDFYYVNINDLLNQAEQFYALYAETLKFVDPTKSTTMSKYKCMIMLMHSSEWAAYGGGYDYVVPALWINPATCKPVGHTIAHEVGHSFHYMCFAEANNHNDSGSINTGFHLNCGKGQAIWEQTAQWQAAMAYPESMFTGSFPLFGNNANYAFQHEWMRYQSYWFHYYLCQYYNDITTVAQVWKTPMTGQSNGNATDFCQAYIKLKNLTAPQFYERYFDYAMHCATFDFDRAAAYRDNYIGNFDYHCAKLADNQYQVAYRSAPQSTGFNVIELDVPTSGTTVTTALKALQHGCAIDEKDPATYNNGEPNTNVKAGVSNYNSAGSASYRGFRMGYVFLKSDGTRTYYNDNTVHCTGTAETTESISTTVPANTSRMFLVVMPALSTYVQHKWDDNIANDDQWPYSFTLTGTDLKTKSETVVYTEAIPEEPEFTKVIDGRDISDVTLTYNVILPADASGYTGAGVTLNTGSAVNALCTAFQLESSAIFGHVIDYTASQGNNTIMSCALTSAGAIQANAKNVTGTFGHWFNASGTVVNWGNSNVVFTEYNDKYASCTVGQMPGANRNGTTRTVREGLIYKDSNGNTAKATIIYNVTFKTDATATAYLTDIDYTNPSETIDPTETLNVERYPGQGFNVTESTVDFTNAMAYLGVTDITTDMLRIVNPDGTLISDYATYDGWFNAEGVATTWGDNTKINVKFFQAILNGTYTICDMNGADNVGTTYNVKWALVANDKTYTFNINVTFVERPAAEIDFEDLNQVGSEMNIDFTSELGAFYEGFKSSVDVASILSTLGVSSLSDLTIYAVQSNGSLDENYKLGGSDGWRNAVGDWQSWGNDAYFCVKTDFTASENQIYFVGGMEGKNIDTPATYSATFAFVNNNSQNHDAVILKVNLIYPAPVAQDITLKDTYESYEVQTGEHNVTLERSLTAGKWLTFCAPFNIYSDEWAGMGIEKVKMLSGVAFENNNVTLNFTDADAIMVGIPYLIKMSETKTGITKEATAYGPSTTIPKTSVNNGTVEARFIGTYVKIDLPDNSYYIQDDKLRHVVYTSDKKTAMKGWRGYFTIDDYQNSIKDINFNFDDKGLCDPTDIESVDVILNDVVDVYSISGTKLRTGVMRLSATDNLPAGIYIVNGKKVIKR